MFTPQLNSKFLMMYYFCHVCILVYFLFFYKTLNNFKITFFLYVTTQTKFCLIHQNFTKISYRGVQVITYNPKSIQKLEFNLMYLDTLL